MPDEETEDLNEPDLLDVIETTDFPSSMDEDDFGAHCSTCTDGANYICGTRCDCDRCHGQDPDAEEDAS